MEANQNVQSYIKDICISYDRNFLHTDIDTYNRLILHSNDLYYLYKEIYGSITNPEESFKELILTVLKAVDNRSTFLRKKDAEKNKQEHNWFLSNQLVGMSLYVDRFAGSLKELPNKLDYLEELGVNYVHVMPIMESPANESDGGYAVSNFRKVDARFGTNEDLENTIKALQEKNMYLMLDIVMNHTSHHHEWAAKAKQGEKKYQDYFYCFDKEEAAAYDKSMPEIFPESSPGSFTYCKEIDKYVMTVFHSYQWDLNFSNPNVFLEMLDTVFYYANMGVDVLRIDAPAFIWKQKGTTCQNLPEAHTLLRLLKACVQVATPGMALLGEAIVAPKEIMKYFGTDYYLAKECDIAYGATNMALQWDALATGDTRVMHTAQQEIQRKPYGTTWISYTRCHDDIGLGYEDSMIAAANFNPYEHRTYLKNFYSGNHAYSTATGALFSVNHKTGDARISGSLASLCGLEKAIANNAEKEITTAINRILLLQAQSLFLGGIPMLFYGDELGYTNDYSYLTDAGKSYDNRWMHRPIIDWEKVENRKEKNTIEERIFSATKNLIAIRKKYNCLSDLSNIDWLQPHNIHIAGFVRANTTEKIVCLFNYQNAESFLTWYAFKEMGIYTSLLDIETNEKYTIGLDSEHLILKPYEYKILLVQH